MESKLIISSIGDIYKRFTIMPSLQRHMIQVAAIAELILSKTDNALKSQKSDVIAACLLHDLGNIVKFNLETEPYWKKVQEEIIVNYGLIDHMATKNMINELGVNERVAFLILEMGFENLEDVINSNDMELKICLYADSRVAPYGVVSLPERFTDLRKRYKNTAFENRYDFSQEKKSLLLEQQIFKNASLHSFSINAQTIACYMSRYLRMT